MELWIGFDHDTRRHLHLEGRALSADRQHALDRQRLCRLLRRRALRYDRRHGVYAFQTRAASGGVAARRRRAGTATTPEIQRVTLSKAESGVY